MKINWLSLSDALNLLSPAKYSHLADNGSLTRRVRNRCPDHFEVQLIDHKTVQLDTQEQKLLNLPDSAQALSRQVFLCCDQQPIIFARTIIGLVEKNRLLTDRITSLGGQSLGSILFRDPLAVKHQMHLACLSLGHSFFNGVDLAGLTADKEVWLRRSLYDYESCDLLVYEAFIAFPDVTKPVD